MKRISHFTLDDILKRRTINSFNKNHEKSQTTPLRKTNQKDDFCDANDN